MPGTSSRASNERCNKMYSFGMPEPSRPPKPTVKAAFSSLTSTSVACVVWGIATLPPILLLSYTQVLHNKYYIRHKLFDNNVRAVLSSRNRGQRHGLPAIEVAAGVRFLPPRYGGEATPETQKERPGLPASLLGCSECYIERCLTGSLQSL